MTPEELQKLLEYINENNSWGDNMYDTICIRHRIAVKYVRVCMDTRDGKVWSVELDCGGGTKETFRVENSDDLKSVYAWLDNTRELSSIKL